MVHCKLVHLCAEEAPLYQYAAKAVHLYTGSTGSTGMNMPLNGSAPAREQP